MGQAGSDQVHQYGSSDPIYVVDRETGTIFNFHVFFLRTKGSLEA